MGKGSFHHNHRLEPSTGFQIWGLPFWRVVGFLRLGLRDALQGFGIGNSATTLAALSFRIRAQGYVVLEAAVGDCER